MLEDCLRACLVCLLVWLLVCWVGFGWVGLGWGVGVGLSAFVWCGCQRVRLLLVCSFVGGLDLVGLG